MISAPPDTSAHPRRNRSRHRARILDWIQRTDSHPTAADIYDALLPEMSSLSLGTVYRNLEILVADGNLDEVESVAGAIRYDGNLSPHHHFDCESCGRVLDVDLPDPRGLQHRLERDYGLRSNRVRIFFSGLCKECTHCPSQSVGVAPKDQRRN